MTPKRFPGENIQFETRRLFAREWGLEDAGNLYLLNSDPKVMEYTGDRPFESVREATRFLENYRDYQKYGMGRWILSRKEDGAFIGWCGLKMHAGEWTDLGFRLLRAYWGRGYATEAGRAALDLGFNTFALPEIIGRAAAANQASLRVLEKLQMNFWKREACEGIPDAVYYRISREEYRNLAVL